MQPKERTGHIELLTIASDDGQDMMRELLKLMQRGLMFGVFIDESQGVYVVPCRATNLMDASEGDVSEEIAHEPLGTVQILATSQSEAGTGIITFNQEATDVGKSIVADLAQLITQGLRFALNVEKSTGIIQSITVARISAGMPTGGESMLPDRNDVEVIGSVPPIFISSGTITYKDTLTEPGLLETLEMPGRIQNAQAYLAQFRELIGEVLSRVSTEWDGVSDEDSWVRNAHRAILDETGVRMQDLSSSIEIERPNLAAGATRAIFETFLICLAITRHPELAKRWIVHSSWRKAEHRRKLGAVFEPGYLDKWEQIKRYFVDEVDFNDDRGWAKRILYQVEDNGSRRRISLEEALDVKELRLVKEYGHFLHPIAEVDRLEAGHQAISEGDLLSPLCNAVEFAGAIVALTSGVDEVIACLPRTAQDDLRRIVDVIMERVAQMVEELGVGPVDGPL